MKWLPLPKIAYGIAIYPFSPTNVIPKRPYSTSNNSLSNNSTSNNSVNEDASTVNSFYSDNRVSANLEDYSHFISLEVGDEIFVIEQQGQWFRGYVLCALEEGKKPNNAPIGCFPRTHIQIKEYIEIHSDEAELLPFKRRKNDDIPRPLDLNYGLPRSFSESFIQPKQSVDYLSPPRPGSFNDLNLEYQLPDFKKSSNAHIPPPDLPLVRFEQSTVTGSSEPLVDEIAACARRHLLDQALSREELIKLRKGIIQRMAIGNMERNQAIIIRHPEKGYLLDATNTPLSSIYKMHLKLASYDRASPLTITNQEREEGRPGRAKFYHLFLKFKSCVARISHRHECTELYFTLYSATEKRFITEPYLAVLNSQGIPKDETQAGRLSTFFVDLSTHDLLDNVYLVCHVIRLGNMKLSEKDYLSHVPTPYIFHSSKHFSLQKQERGGGNLCRRPFGCAVLKLNSFLLSDSATVDQSMTIYTPTTEANYAELHEHIILNHIKEYSSSSKLEEISISLRTFYGLLDEVVKENAGLLQDVSRTLRIGFADAVFSDDSRNELYITLDSGDFGQLGKMRNIQVTMSVRDSCTGEAIENAILPGSGARSVTYWESMVFYHELKPKWKETIKITMNDTNQWERSHVYLTVKHRSSHYTGPQSNQIGTSPYSGGGEKTVAMGFLPLFLPPLYRDFVADGKHTMYLYKYDRESAHPRGYLHTVPCFVRSSAPSNAQQTQEKWVKRPIRKSGHTKTPSTSSFKSFNGSFASSGQAFSSNTSAIEASSIMSSHSSHSKLSMLQATVSVSTFLCSTQFTQNKTLVRLLNWRLLVEEGSDHTELLSVLSQFTFVGEREAVKFLRNIFDALFDLLVYRQSGNVDEKLITTIKDQALASIIWLLSIVQDRRFSNFRPVLDVYIEDRFSIEEYDRQFESGREEKTFNELLKSLNRLCKNSGEAAKAKLLHSSMKVWDYLFRFIVRSRLCHRHKESTHEREIRDNILKTDIYTFLDSIKLIMSPDQPSAMIGTQTLALQHFSSILVELHCVFLPQQIVSITTSFVDACSHVTGRLVGYKLAMILDIVKSPVFKDPGCRLDLGKNVFCWIRVWLNSYLTTAKDIIFAKQAECQQQPDSDHQQTRLQRAQWIENLRLSLTILSEVLNVVRKSTGMTCRGLSSKASLFSGASRPTSLATTIEEDETTSTDSSQSDLTAIMGAALELVPRLLNAYRDIQRLTIQALRVSEPTEPQSRKSSLAPKRDLAKSSHNSQHTVQNDKSRFTVVLQALNTSSNFPYPSTYPLHTKSDLDITTDCAAIISTGLLDLTVVILELFYLTSKQQWLDFIKGMTQQEGVEKTAEFLRQVVYTCMAILFGDSIASLEEIRLMTDCMTHHEDSEIRNRRKIPHNWLNLNVISHQVVICNILEPISNILELPSFVPAEEAYLQDDITNPEERSVLLLWRVFFVGFLRTIESPVLELTCLTAQEQRAVWKMTGNIRGEVGARTFLGLWEFAKKQKVLKRRTVHSLDYFNQDYSMFQTTPRFSQEYSLTEDPKENKPQPPESYFARQSIRIGPMDELPSPLTAIHEEKAKVEMSFLQADLAYHILGALCAVSLTSHSRVRLNAFSVIADIASIELYSYGELVHIQHLLISTFDRLVMLEKKGDSILQGKMKTELNRALEHRLQEDNRMDLNPIGKNSVDSLCTFLGLLLQIRNLPADDDEFMDERISATLKLMKFIQVIEREEVYIKYVHQLVQLHVESRNFIEAALTLRFHADLVDWDSSDRLSEVSELHLPSQSSFDRKESLYMKMIGYLEEGNAWELCVELCKELAYQYENNVYDYAKMSSILKREAELFENMAKKERCFTEYFRVGFYGRGFPPGCRNQQYIYRGLEWEKMPSFVERMQNRHPNAQLLPSKLSNVAVLHEDDLKALEVSLDGQYLQITPVVPLPDSSLNSCLTNTLAPESVKKYYLSNAVSKFSFSHPIIKESVKTNEEKQQPESDFLNLWTERIDFVCEDQFPNIVRRSLIVSAKTKEVSPIENAINAMENKNSELTLLEKKYVAYLDTRSTVNINPFSMSLNGAVDAPVNGGVPLYKKAFLSQEYWNRHPEMRVWITRLQRAIIDQVCIIEKCLETHDRLVSSEMRPFHTTLTEFFQKNFAEEIKQAKERKGQEKAASSKSNSVSSQRRSTSHSENAMDTSSLLSLHRHNSYSTHLSTPISHPAHSPVSRAFSIKGSMVEGSPGPSSLASPTSAFENASTSRAESLSRTLKISLRKKKKSHTLGEQTALMS
ncbi:hypothetical protein BY458DRAFT_442545 [Sporodiniella umbellata]|nr:hypothetical protein BY458DRAFT_442545 [Sporodiniella umbellata]